jgi:Flp pilus assembly protein TadG
MKFFRPGRKNSQRGATMVEFALSILLTVFVIFWTFEMVMMVYTYTVISDSAKEGVRYAIVHGANSGTPSTPKDTSAVDAVVKDYAKYSLHDLSGTALSVATAYPDATNKAPHPVSVTVTYQYQPYINLPFTSPTITATAEGRIAY